MSDPFIGEIRMFGGNFAPQGWAFCNGQMLSVADYSELHSLIGTLYGGEGDSVFALPDLQGRLPMCKGEGYQQGQSIGVETVSLSADQIPAHTHKLQAASTGQTAQPAENVLAVAGTAIYSGTEAITSLSPDSIGNTGEGKAHDNMQPFLCISFIIALEGIYPSQG